MFDGFISKFLAIGSLLGRYLILQIAFVGVANAAPISTQWVYEVSVMPGAPTPDATSKLLVGAASLLGKVGIGSGQDGGTIDKSTFSLHSQIVGSRILSSVLSNLEVVRNSNGRFFNGVALTMRYTDKRGSSEELVSIPNLGARRYEFSKGGKPNGVEPFNMAASDLLMAPYVFLGKPVSLKSSFLALSDGKSIRQINLSPKLENFILGGKSINGVRFSGRTSSGIFDLWVRAEDGYPLRMRIGLGSKYGAVLDQIAKDIPANFILL